MKEKQKIYKQMNRKNLTEQSTCIYSTNRWGMGIYRGERNKYLNNTTNMYRKINHEAWIYLLTKKYSPRPNSGTKFTEMEHIQKNERT
jgi:hypothetical protein